MRQPVTHLVVGPERHGVVRFGLDLHAALLGAGAGIGLERTLGDVAPGAGVHLQFTDRLFGADAEQAVAAVRVLAADTQRSGRRITATLHDLPQSSDGAHHDVRARAYGALCSIVDGIVVSSEHERSLLREMGFTSSATVIPLPITSPVTGAPTRPQPPSVAVFGFVYPGKGHAEVLDAMRGLPDDVAMMAIGAPSAGHDDLIDELEDAAQEQHRSFVVTGHVPDAGVVPMLQAATVPVVPHRHVSASGSLNSWITAGRRPLVPATRYFREIADRNPGALWLYDDDPQGLVTAIRAALDEPSSTWLPPDVVCSPSPGQAADDYRRMLESVHR